MPSREVTYRLTVPKGGWRRSFDIEYANKIQPIAETLAMLDGNAFPDSWQNYLPEADAVYRNNGGDDGWASICSWIEKDKIIKTDPTLKDLWDKLETIIALKSND
jgi:hypothetical protein